MHTKPLIGIYRIKAYYFFFDHRNVNLTSNSFCKCNVNIVSSGCARGYPASLQAQHSNNLKQIIQIKKNPNW